MELYIEQFYNLFFKGYIVKIVCRGVLFECLPRCDDPKINNKNIEKIKKIYNKLEKYKGKFLYIVLCVYFEKYLDVFDAKNIDNLVEDFVNKRDEYLKIPLFKSDSEYKEHLDENKTKNIFVKKIPDEKTFEEIENYFNDDFLKECMKTYDSKKKRVLDLLYRNH